MDVQNNEEIKIRIANKRDVGLLLQWGKKMYEIEKQYMPLLKYSEVEAKERYESQINNPLFYFLIVEYKDEPVGYLYAHLDKVDYLETDQKQCEIEVIYLDEKARGKKISPKLINKCIEWAKQNNAFEIKAGIFTENTASKKAFESLGFSAQHITYTKELKKYTPLP